MISRKKFMALQEELIRKEKEIVGLRKEVDRLKEQLHNSISETSKEQERGWRYAVAFDEAYDLACKIMTICGRRER